MKKWLTPVVIREMQIKMATHPLGWLPSERQSVGAGEDAGSPRKRIRTHRWLRGGKGAASVGKPSEAFACCNLMEPPHTGYH